MREKDATITNLFTPVNNHQFPKLVVVHLKELILCN